MQAEFSRNPAADTQSIQSAQTNRTAQNEGVQQQQQQQQQSETTTQYQEAPLNAQAERRIQRSSSSASSKSSISGAGAAGGLRAEGPIGTGAYQQHSTEISAGFEGSAGSLGSSVSGERRQGRFRRQVIRLPDQPSGQVRQVRRRLPTPEPDTLERVYVQRTGAEVVEEITEIPTTPPPRVQERTVVEPAGPPQVVKRTIRVPPRGGAYGGYQQQQQQQQQGFGYQATGGFTGGATFGGAAQQTVTGAAQQTVTGAVNYQQPASGGFAGGYGTTAPAAFPTATTFATNYGSLGGAGGLPQPTGPATGAVSFTVDASSSQVLPPTGCQPAFCFYV